MTPGSASQVSGYGGVDRGYLAAVAANRAARLERAAGAEDGGFGSSLQPSLIWARPLRVLSTSSTGFQGDLIQANGGFVAGVAEVDGRGRVLRLTPSSVLVDPAQRRANGQAEQAAGQDRQRREALAQGATPAEAQAVAIQSAPVPVASPGAQAATALRTQAAYQGGAGPAVASGGAGGAGATRVNVTA